MAITEQNRLNDILKWEQEKRYSRDEVTVASGQNLALGTVVGKVTSTGKYKILAPSATDGTKTAAGFMVADCDASTGDTKGVIVARDAIVNNENLVWPGGITAGQKTTALADLKAIGIVSRSVA